MKTSILIFCLVGLALATLCFGQEDGNTMTREYTEEELEAYRQDLLQTPAEDRHLKLKKLIKLGILAKILALPALAASLIPLGLIPLLLLLKHKVPPVNIIPLPPPTPYYEPQSYEPAPYNPPTYNQPQSYDAPAYSAPAPAYAPPAPAYSPPAPAYTPPAYAPAPAYSPPAYSPPQPSYNSYGPPPPQYRRR